MSYFTKKARNDEQIHNYVHGAVVLHIILGSTTWIMSAMKSAPVLITVVQFFSDFLATKRQRNKAYTPQDLPVDSSAMQQIT